METTRRWFLQHYPHGGATELSDSLDAAVLAHAYARHSDDVLVFAATRVAPVLERSGWAKIARWADAYRATGSLWLS